MTKRSYAFFHLSVVFLLLAIPAPLASERPEAVSSSVARHLRLQGLLEGDVVVAVVGDDHLGVGGEAVKCVEIGSAVVLALDEVVAWWRIIKLGGMNRVTPMLRNVSK